MYKLFPLSFLLPRSVRGDINKGTCFKHFHVYLSRMLWSSKQWLASSCAFTYRDPEFICWNEENRGQLGCLSAVAGNGFFFQGVSSRRFISGNVYNSVSEAAQSIQQYKNILRMFLLGVIDKETRAGLRMGKRSREGELFVWLLAAPPCMESSVNVSDPERNAVAFNNTNVDERTCKALSVLDFKCISFTGSPLGFRM